MDMATLNTRVGWSANANSSIGWFRDNSKPIYRTYGLENMAGYYWYQSNISGSFGGAYNCTVFHSATRPPVGADNCRYSLYQYVDINCCQDGGLGGNCNCNCANNCGNCYSFGGYGNPYGVNGEGQCDQCAQCTINTNCDSRAWMQPNCNCAQCNCACNCYGAGQCVTTNCNCG